MPHLTRFQRNTQDELVFLMVNLSDGVKRDSGKAKNMWKTVIHLQCFMTQNWINITYAVEEFRPPILSIRDI